MRLEKFIEKIEEAKTIGINEVFIYKKWREEDDRIKEFCEIKKVKEDIEIRKGSVFIGRRPYETKDVVYVFPIT